MDEFIIYAGDPYVAWFQIRLNGQNIETDSIVKGGLIDNIKTSQDTLVIIEAKSMTWNPSAMSNAGRWQLDFSGIETANLRVVPADPHSQLRWKRGYIEVQVDAAGIIKTFHKPATFQKAFIDG